MPRRQAPSAPSAPPAIDLPLCRESGIRHVGVVFVHGIGSQEQGEILRDWGGAIARVLVDFRVATGAGGDPVLTCQLDATAEGPTYVELELPPTEDEGREALAEEHWLLTEAWWAHEVTPPSFGQMAQWLGPDGAVPRIVQTIIPRAGGATDPRALPNSVEPSGTPLPGLGRTRERRDTPAPDRAKRAVADWREAPVRQTRSILARAGAWAYLQAFSALLLLLYGALRSIETLIPVGPLANGALTRPIDRFVLEWFGDVFVLLGVPAQAASVRGRLAGRIRDLMDAACDQIVVIAHSGGAIVAWTTLVDASSKELRVDSLVTIGEGLNLGWNITSGDVEGRRAPGVLERARQRFRLLYVPLLSQRPTLRWVDYWASRDPASSGPISPPDRDLVPPADRFTNQSIWNRLSFRQDHGGYWDNDEEFVIPLLRRLEGDRGAGASFFGPIESHERRSIRRRRRVSVLSVWSQLCLMAPVAAIITSFVAGNGLVPEVGDAIASAWAVVPGNQLVSEPLNAIRGLHLETVGPIDTLAEVGVWVVAGLFLAVTVFALISPPERSAPWNGVQGVSLRVIEVLVRHGPVLAGVPLLVLAGTAAARFASGATPAGLAAVTDSLPWVVGGVALAVAVALLSPRFPWIRIAATAVILALGTYALIAPIVGIVVFADVGRMALGSVAIIAGFAIVSRIGTWRWTAWDLRERLASHARTPVYGGVGLVAIQSVILLVSLALYFLAVGFALGPVALVATALVLAAVFVGIAIDVNHVPPGEGTQQRTKFEGFTMQRRL